jgi:hypothetical protein
MNNSIPFKRTFALGASMLAALAFAVPAFAGEDDDEDSAPVTQQAPQSSGGGGGGGGSDTQHATGGVQTGAGAMATVADDNAVLPLALIGGGVLVLTASGLAFRRREDAV